MESVKIKNCTIEKIHEVEKKSETFSVQRFSVKENEGQYPQVYEVQCTGKTLGVLNGYKVGDKVNIEANLNGREYQKKDGTSGVFMTLGVWKIEKVSEGQAPQPQPQPSKSFLEEPPF